MEPLFTFDSVFLCLAFLHQPCMLELLVNCWNKLITENQLFEF